MNILTMEGVCLSFARKHRDEERKQVLSNLIFAVRRGETFGFLGPSGAGKTTTIKLLTRQLAKDSGRISSSGAPSKRRSSRLRAHRYPFGHERPLRAHDHR